LEIKAMCRNIKNLFNFDPPVTEEEVRAASLQFVRKISGFNKPSKANEGPFQTAIGFDAAAAFAGDDGAAEESRGRGDEGEGAVGGEIRGLEGVSRWRIALRGL
jgi:hypothetical protein